MGDLRVSVTGRDCREKSLVLTQVRTFRCIFLEQSFLFEEDEDTAGNDDHDGNDDPERVGQVYERRVIDVHHEQLFEKHRRKGDQGKRRKPLDGLIGFYVHQLVVRLLEIGDRLAIILDLSDHLHLFADELVQIDFGVAAPELYSFLEQGF